MLVELIFFNSIVSGSVVGLLSIVGDILLVY